MPRRAADGLDCASTQAPAAIRTCSTVRYRLSVVFFSVPLMNTGTEQLAQLTDVQVAVNPSPRASLEVVHAQLSLGHLETPLNRPAGERDPQHPLQARAAGADHEIRQEVFHFFR